MATDLLGRMVWVTGNKKGIVRAVWINTKALSCFPILLIEINNHFEMHDSSEVSTEAENK
jgi:hypothetical protein